MISRSAAVSSKSSRSIDSDSDSASASARDDVFSALLESSPSGSVVSLLSAFSPESSLLSSSLLSLSSSSASSSPTTVKRPSSSIENSPFRSPFISAASTSSIDTSSPPTRFKIFSTDAPDPLKLPSWMIAFVTSANRFSPPSAATCELESPEESSCIVFSTVDGSKLGSATSKLNALRLKSSFSVAWIGSIRAHRFNPDVTCECEIT
ncbi:hypothetical protein HTG_04515 [Natrinema mahii]|nr:hypothetical protein HTG_04515 [Natrinema mahii]